MDNVKYYNDSLAYDFNRFMPREKSHENKENIVKLSTPKVRQRKKKAARKLSVTSFAVLSATIVLAALFGNIFLRLQVNEVNAQINDVKAQINEIDSERTSLEMEFERKVSFSNIELEATQLGMQKKDKSQVKYIRVNDKNTATTESGELVVSKN